MEDAQHLDRVVISRDDDQMTASPLSQEREVPHLTIERKARLRQWHRRPLLIQHAAKHEPVTGIVPTQQW